MSVETERSTGSHDRRSAAVPRWNSQYNTTSEFTFVGGTVRNGSNNGGPERRVHVASRRDVDECDAIHVLYIAGIGRSGSTLLCRTIGSVQGFLGTGELMRILGRGVATGDLCSCGTPVDACDLWRGVMADLLQRHPDFDLERLERTRQRVTEEWEVLRYMLLRPRRSSLGRDLAEFRRFLSALYRSIHRVTGTQVIVDASKSSAFAKLLTETPGLRVNVLHLVRDSRGVAHSLTRRKERPGTSGRQEHFEQHGAVWGSVLWSAAHVTSEWLGRWATRVIRVRYEDFVANPSTTLQAILQELAPAYRPPSIPHVNGRSVRLSADHLIASNPNRTRTGDVELHEDVAWRREMGTARQWLVTGLTYPLLRRYGYRTGRAITAGGAAGGNGGGSHR